MPDPPDLSCLPQEEMTSALATMRVDYDQVKIKDLDTSSNPLLNKRRKKAAAGGKSGSTVCQSQWDKEDLLWKIQAKQLQRKAAPNRKEKFICVWGSYLEGRLELLPDWMFEIKGQHRNTSIKSGQLYDMSRCDITCFLSVAETNISAHCGLICSQLIIIFMYV